MFFLIKLIRRLISFGCSTTAKKNFIKGNKRIFRLFLSCFFVLQVRCRTHANYVIARSRFSNRTIDIFPTIPMNDHIAAQYANVLSKNYLHCTTIKEFTAVKNHLNAKHAVKYSIGIEISFSLSALFFNVQ